MTDKEIIQALECCGKNHITGSTDACEHCFLQNSAMCVTELIYKALDLINRIKGDVIHYRRKAQNQKQELSRLNAEIERLKNSGIRANSVEDWLDYCNGLKSEAIKECLDRIEAFLCGVCGSVVEDNPNLDRILFGYNTEEVDAFIDNLRKEMVGEQQ